MKNIRTNLQFAKFANDELNKSLSGLLSRVMRETKLTSETVKLVVRLVYKLDIDFCATTREREKVNMKKLYAIIRLLYLNETAEVTARELNITRATVYHYCGYFFDEYETDRGLREIVSKLFSEEDVNLLKLKFESKKRKK